MAINNYALNLELNLANNTASVLKNVYDDFARIEEQISRIAKSNAVLNDVGSELNSSVLEVQKSLDGISKNMESILPPTLKDDVKHYEDMDRLFREIDKSTKTTKEYSDGITDNVSNLRTNLLPRVNQQVNDLGDAFNNAGNNVNGVTNRIRGGGKAIFGLTGAVFSLGEAFKVAGNEQELFVTANYRLLGSQIELTHATRDLTNQYGLLRQEALDAYIALAQTKLPRDELMKLSAEVGMFGRITGVSSQQTAEFARRNRMIGVGSEATGRQLKYMSNAMRAFGLSTQDISTIMNGMNDETAYYNHLSEQQVKSMNETTTALAGFAKSKGFGADIAVQLNKIANSADMASMETRAYMSAMTGIDLTPTADANQNLVNTFKALDIAMRDVNANDPASMAVWEAQCKQMGLSATQAKGFIEAVNAETAKTGETFEQAASRIQKEGGNLSELFKEANQTLQRGWAQAWERIFQVFMRVMDAIAPAILWFIDYVIDPLISIIEALTGSTDGLTRAMYRVVDGLKILLAPFKAVWYLITGNYAALKDLGNQVWTFIKTLAALAVGIYAVVTAFRVMRAAAAFLNNTRIFNPRAMLSFATVLVAAGIAAFGLGYALDALAKAGWLGVAMVAALTPALIALGVAIAVIAAFRGWGVAACLALSVVFLSLGAAAVGLGVALGALALAINAASEMFKVLKDFLNHLTPEKVLGLFAFGVAFITAASAIAVGSAILTLAIPAILLGTWILCRTIDKLAERAAALESIAGNLRIFAQGFALLSASVPSIKAMAVAITEFSNAIAYAAITIQASAAAFLSSMFSLTISMFMLVAGLPIIERFSRSMKTLADSFKEVAVGAMVLRAVGDSFDKLLNFVDLNNFESTVSGIARILDNYGVRIKESANLISSSLRSVSSATQMANMPELQNTVSTKSIVTVKMTREDESKQKVEQRKLMDELKEHSKSLRGLLDLVAKITDGNQTGKIYDLLDEFLPIIAENKPVLHNTQMCNWTN